MQCSRMESSQSLLSVISKGGKSRKYRLDRDPEKGSTRLKLQGKELVSVPTEIFDLEELQILDMSPERESCLTYRLDLVPKEIGQLRNLSVLCLDTNELKSIPSEIGTLENLERLTLSNNNLTFLPEEIGKLQKLTSLHLANNLFQDFPVHICLLRKLTFLDISDNKVKVMSDRIQNLTQLETLLLFFNRLERLPDSFCNLRSLRTLWLGKNRLKALPEGFGKLVNLEWENNQCSSNFEDNPLERPPVETCRGGPKQIELYFATWGNREND